MTQVFNCGHRMELYVAPEHAAVVIAAAAHYAIPAKIVGKVLSAEQPTQKRLTIVSEHGEFTW